MKYIIVDPEICHGKPVFKGTRIMVWEALDMLKAGESVESIIRSFPSLNKEMIEEALEYAVKVLKAEENVRFT